jgi:hypothetical protein
MQFEFKFWRLLLKQYRRRLTLSHIAWRKKGFSSPSPHSVKMAVLKRYGPPDSTWIETGSYLGETASRLSRMSKQVHSIEPEKSLFEFVSWRYKKIDNLKFYYGPSEKVLEDLVRVQNANTCFWLDGHFSGDITYRGDDSSPIIFELSVIEKYLANLENVRVLVDDVRDFAFQSNDSSYPNLNYLVSWASKNNLNWTIEHDIFIAGFKLADVNGGLLH